jgi:sialate O-acetylesterase
MVKPIALLLCAAAAAFASADPRVPAIFGDHMVLQAGGKVPIWGWAEPYERIDFEFAGNHRTVFAGRDGFWQVELRNLQTGGPHEMTIKGNSTLQFKNILIGEVWLASGQSNMEWAWNYFPENKKPAVGETDFPDIRFFMVAKKASGELQTDVQGKWVVCNADTMKDFSLVGFFFARELYTNIKRPVGIIGSYWGGTPAEAWTRMGALEAMPETKPMADHYKAVAANYEGALADYQRKLAEWDRKVRFQDPGNSGFTQGYANPAFDDSVWRTLKQPAAWEDLGKPEWDIDGIVWYRRKFDIPQEWAGRSLILNLGQIDDVDVTYFNGVQIGTTSGWEKPRVYTIPGDQVKAGSATIAVRILDTGGKGGIVAGPIQVVPEDRSPGPIKLDGDWKYKIEASRPTPPPSFWAGQPQQPYGPGSAVSPTNLWNGMIHPLVPYGVRGFIWYQGESNAGRAYQYRSLFPGMIKDWRMGFANPNAPFYFVQLANFMARGAEPEESEWAELREAQTMTLRLKNTGMAVAIDVGEAGDIHPADKKSVGERLARWALNRDYGMADVVASGPIYRSHGIEGDRIVLEFDFAEMGLATTSGQPLRGFSIAGADRKFVWAESKIVGSKVVVWSPQVREPKAVRYGWANNPAVNLINKAGLPASPFRTDSWPGLTVDRR